MTIRSRSIAFGILALLAGAGAWLWLVSGAEDAGESPADARAPSPPAAAAPGELPRFESAQPAAEPLAVPVAPGAIDAPGVAGAVTLADPSRLETLARLAGRVTRKDSGQPVAGLTVEAVFAPLAVPIAAFTVDVTDAEGRFRFALAAPSRVTSLRVAAGDDTRGASRELDLALDLGAEVVQDLQVVAGATVSGRVVNQAGQPVAGARVRAWNVNRYVLDAERDRLADREAHADTAGAFRLGGLGPDCVLAADAPGLTGVARLSGEIASGGVAEGLTLTLGPARELAGRVLGPGEAPVADCRVDVDADGGQRPDHATGVPGFFRIPPPRATARSDAAGRFILPSLADLPYAVRAWENRFVPWQGRHAPGDPELVIHLVAGTTLTGELLTELGAPVAGAEVTVATLANGPWPQGLHQVQTDVEGRFEATGLLPDERGALLIRAAGHALHVEQPLVITEQGPNHVRLVLAPGRALAGVVVDASDRPLAGRRLSIVGDRLLPVPEGMTLSPLPTWESLFAEAASTTSDDSGRFRFEQLYDGLFELSVAETEGQGVAAAIQARSGSEDLRLVVGGAGSGVTLSGTVRDAATGLPVERFEFSAMLPSGLNGMAGDSNTFENADGTFRITGLPPGPIQPWLRAAGYSDLHVPLRGYEAGEHRLELTMSADRTLHLRVLDEDREPVEGAKLGFRDEAGETMWVKSGPNSGTTSLETDERGEVIAMGLPASRLTVRVKTGFFGSAEEFRFDLRQELRGVQELVLGGEQEMTVLVMFFGTAETAAEETAPDFHAALKSLQERLAAGSVWALETPVVIRALGGDGRVLAEQHADPAAPPAGDGSGPGGGSLAIPGLPGVSNVKLTIPAEPLELEAAAEGYATLRRAWQPDRSSHADDVVILLLRRSQG